MVAGEQRQKSIVNDMRHSLTDQLSWVAMKNSKVQGNVDEI